MYKYIGIIAIMIICTLYGCYASYKLKDRFTELMEIKRMILLLRGEIEYARTPIGTAFQNISKKCSDGIKIGTVLNQIAIELQNTYNSTFYEVWDRIINEEYLETNLKESDIKRLKQLGSQMGYLDTKMQLSNMDLYLTLLEGDIGEAKEEYDKNSKVYKKLGFLIGIMVAIILV